MGNCSNMAKLNTTLKTIITTTTTTTTTTMTKTTINHVFFSAQPGKKSKADVL